MGKLVVINPGGGSLVTGFSQVTAKLWTTDSALPEQFVGSLPPAPGLIDLYRQWQLFYRCLCDRPSLRTFTAMAKAAAVEDLEIDSTGITNVSQTDFHQVCEHLCTDLNNWLLSPGFSRIERRLRSHLNPGETIRVILETHDEWLWRLPWYQWEFFQDHPKAEIALSKPEYKRQPVQHRQVPRQTIRILAILGNSQGIDLEAEVAFLNSLQDAETTFLNQPSRQEFNRQLWDRQGWDILFFAGHSHTQEMTGRLYINDHPTHNSITVQQLDEALKAAIEQGLQLAIFNSCDGLGLALALETLHIPTVAIMREPVPNQVAQTFFKYFLDAFAIEHLPFHQAIGQARRYLQGIEDEFPGASWLPVICQNPATVPPTWQQFREMQTLASERLASERLVSERSASERLASEPQVNPLFPAPANPSPIDFDQAHAAAPQISQDFIQHCQRCLAEVLGPIAGFLIKQCLVASPQISEAELVESLAVAIPDAQKAAAFRQRLFGAG